ncbi:MAG: gluconate 2-dehydrogenase subunit 3 family protein [Kordiimonadaceae bacterium]|jgi:gluconate 2-dehydrogenase gamma chain|nr:gluconate 2-dehydrogenase subunit 3 family protein [Kordiimonadaceae bacterium]MBT6033274.1 gluconate 2-dehydrogenase subunit 3 family protein [Kordiimonadaceae bacterium]
MEDINRRDILTGLTAMLGVSALSTIHANAIEVGFGFKPSGKNAIFNEQQMKIVELIANIIIPDTDTPGASKAGVHLYIDHMAGNWMTKDEASSLIKGIDKINTDKFTSLNHEEQVVFVQNLDDNRDKEQTYNTLKSYTVVGYYTSEIGSTLELNYDPVPGKYEEIPFDSVGKVWA